MTNTSQIFKSLYIFFALLAGIFLLGFSAILFIISDPRVNPAWSWGFLIGGVVLLYSCHYTRAHTKRKVNNIIAQFSHEGFKPTPGYEIDKSNIGRYFGVDTEHGTILLVSVFDKIYKGLTVSDLAGYECKGSVITLKFKDVKFPYFVVNAGSESKSMDFCLKLDVLFTSSYKPKSHSKHNFSEFVENKSFAL
jgi:hypothetical protein